MIIDEAGPAGVKQDLPVLNSERKEFTNKIIQLEQEKDLIYASVLRKITGIVNRADFMSDEVKNELLKLIWEK